MMRKVMTEGFLHGEWGIRRNLIVTVNWMNSVTIADALVHLERIIKVVNDERLKDELRVVESLLNNMVEPWVNIITGLNGGGRYNKLIEALYAFRTVIERGRNHERIIDQAMRLAQYLSEARLAIKPRFLPWVNKVLLVLIGRANYDDDFMIKTIRDHEAYNVGNVRVELTKKYTRESQSRAVGGSVNHRVTNFE